MNGDENSKPVNIDPRWCAMVFLRLIQVTGTLTPAHSIQEALRIYFQPIKHDDPKLDFYTMYKRETMEYDTQYMEKYNEDLNTTLIFVRFRVLNFTFCSVHRPLRLVCSQQSVPHSSSTFNPSSSQILATGPKPTSEQSSLPLIHPSHHTKTPPLPQHGMVPPRRSLRPLTSFTQVSSCRYWPLSSRCWENSG